MQIVCQLKIDRCWKEDVRLATPRLGANQGGTIRLEWIR